MSKLEEILFFYDKACPDSCIDVRIAHIGKSFVVTVWAGHSHHDDVTQLISSTSDVSIAGAVDGIAKELGILK